MTLFTVLIVDDEREFREMTQKRLAKRDIHCECAENGEKALERIMEKDDIDVVLL